MIAVASPFLSSAGCLAIFSLTRAGCSLIDERAVKLCEASCLDGLACSGSGPWDADGEDPYVLAGVSLESLAYVPRTAAPPPSA